MTTTAGKPERPKCPHCGEPIRYRPREGEPPPTICGQIVCRAVEHWDTDRWESQWRMAMARKVAGIDPSPLDREAARRLNREL